MKFIFVVLLCMGALSLTHCSHSHKGHDHHKHAHKMKHKGHSKMWKKMDANSDGAVTKAEFDKAHADSFSKMDKNGDGKVSKDEMVMHHKAMKSEKKACCN